MQPSIEENQSEEILNSFLSPRYLRRFIAVLLLFWTMIVALMFVWSARQQIQQVRSVALAEARSYINRDEVFRLWVASHGGVYVPVDERTPPNPLLAHVPERDLVTSVGTRLTLMNSAYILRQISQEFADLHLTSLNPLRPENTPDVWEKAALLAFEQGDAEVYEFTEINDEAFLRLMRPIYTKESCLKCHAQQGYQVGYIRGGAAVILPTERLWAASRTYITGLGLGLGILWLGGSLGILAGSRRFLTDAQARKKADEQLREQMGENNKRTQELEAIVDVSAAMRKAETRTELMGVLLEKSLSIMGAQAGALGILNGNSLIFQAAAGQAVGWEGKIFPQDQNLFWEVLREGIPRFVDSPIDDDSFFFLTSIEELHPPVQACIITPLKSGAATMGVLFIWYCIPRQISNTHKRLATAIADMAGNALHRMTIADALKKLVADRTRELDTIYKVTAAASKPARLDTALGSALDPILDSVDAQVGAILLVDDKNRRIRVLAEKDLPAQIKNQIETLDRKSSLEGWVLKHKQLLLIPDLAADPRVYKRTRPKRHFPFAALPMRVGERIVGILEIGRIGGSQFDLDELTLLSFIADHLGLVIENAHLLEQAEHNAVLEERSRLARELHDSVTQTLYSLNLFAGAGRNLAASDKLESIRQHFITIESNALQALKEMRLLIYELRPTVLEEEGLSGALQKRLDAVERRSAMKVNLFADENLVLPGWIEAEIYRIAQEALNNVLKHARASRVDVSLKTDKGILVLEVVDDGAGFDLEQVQNQGGQGLESLRERVKKINGRLSISSSRQRGTEVKVEVKL